jgi:hypothetical protein
MPKREHNVAWDDEFWVDSPSLGSVHDLSGEHADAPPVILVPDGKGDYREHVAVKPKGRLGF